ncbi:MAG: HEPN domain-containing protein [bacterium]
METVVAFHVQQVIEKALKAVIVHHGGNPPRVHDLPRLAALVREHEPTADLDLDTLERVTQYYIESRYPVTVETPTVRVPSKDEIESMVSFGKSILAWARTRIG